MTDEKPTTINLGEPEQVAPEIPADAQQPPPPSPTVTRFPVKVYFLAYVVETGKGRKYGNHIIKSPQPLSTTSQLRKIEELVSQALPATHGIVGNRGIVTITSICDLGVMMVEETLTEEGAKAEDEGAVPTDNAIADQPS